MKEEMLFNSDTIWEEHWQDMPEFNMTPEVPILTIKVSFKRKEDIEKFGELMGQKIHENIKNYWFPKLNRKAFSGKKYHDNEP